MPDNDDLLTGQENTNTGEGDGDGEETKPNANEGEGEGKENPEGDEKPEGEEKPEGDGDGDDGAGEGEEKPDGDEKPDGPPEEYEDFTFPEGVDVDPEVLTQFKDFAKENGFTQEQAQKVVDLQSQMSGQQMEKVETFFEQRHKDWTAEIQRDKDFGGDKLQPNAALANRVLATFDPDDDVAVFLKEIRAANHPAMFRMLVRIGEAVGDDTLVGGDEKTEDNRNKPPHEKMGWNSDDYK